MADDYSHEPGTTGLVSVGGQTTGVIEQHGDEDWIRVSLQAGSTYSFDLLGGYVVDYGSGPNSARVWLFGPHGYVAEFASVSGGPPKLEYKATMTGDHFVSVRWAAPGSYTVRVAESVQDDYRGNTTTTASLAMGATVNGKFEIANDSDWLKVDLVAGATYAFAFNTRALDMSYWDGFVPELKLYGADGAALASEATGNPLLYYTPTHSGSYYVGVNDSAGHSTGTYTLSASIPGVADDYGSDTDSSAPIVVGAPVGGNIELGGDKDWFKVAVQAGTTYEIAVSGAQSGGGTLGAGSTENIIVRLPGFTPRQDVAYASDGGIGGDPVLYYTPLSAGTIDISVEELSGKGLGSYTLRVAPSTRDDYAGNATTTGTIAVGGHVTGELQSQGDRDWFKVTLEAGTPYTFSLSSGTAAGGTPLDGAPYLGVYHENGQPDIEQSQQYGGSDVHFTPELPGIYHVGVQPHWMDDVRGTYTVRASKAAGDDHGGSITNATTILVDTRVAGRIDSSGDHDLFKFVVEAGTSYSFDLLDTSTGLSGGNPLLFDGLGTNTIFPTWSGQPSKPYFTTQAGGTYFLRVSGKAIDYSLQLHTLADDFAGYTNTRGTLAVGGEQRGSLQHTNDRDWFAVEMQAGTSYLFDLRSASGQVAGNAAMSLHARDGERLDKDAVHDGKLYYTPATSGMHYLGLALRGGSPQSYLLRANPVEDDYAGSVATEGTLAIGAQRTGTVQYKSDADWFKVSLEAGKGYYFDLRGMHGGGGTLGTAAGTAPLLSLHDSAGELLRSEIAGGSTGNPLLLFAPKASGTYHLAVSERAGTGIGSYTLASGEAVVVDDFAADLSTTATLEPGARHQGELQFAGDEDWVAVTLHAGMLYKFELRDAGGNGTGWSSYLSTYSGSGAHIYTQEDTLYDGESAVYLRPAYSGTYYVGVNQVWHEKTRPYTLDVSLRDPQPGDSYLGGSPGNDLFLAADGHSQIDGDLGIDVLRFTDGRPGFLRPAQEAESWWVGPSLQLTRIERLEYPEVNVALDLAGQAGMVAKTIGAVLGADAVHNWRYVGIGLDFMQDNASYEALMDMALNAVLGTDATAQEIVEQLYSNVAGAAPPAAALAFYVPLLESGEFTPAGLGVFAAEHALNAGNIGLVGLASAGLLYQTV